MISVAGICLKGEWQGTVQGEGCTEVTPSIGIDYWLYTMATPVQQYIISPFFKRT